MAKQGLRAYAEKVADAGRNGDTELAHLSPDEIAILNSLQGHVSINPDTGLPEYFSLGKILKGVAKAAGALAGGYFGGPAGAAVGAGAVSALMGDSTTKALTTGLMAGLGSYGAQQTGLGDYIGGGFSSGADLLGQQAADSGIQTASAAADSVASSGGGFDLSSILPAIGIGASALGAATYKPPKTKALPKPEEIPVEEYEPLDREQMAYAEDPYSYGVFSPEFQYFDEVNPAIQPMRDGGRVGFKYGGNVSEGGKKQGGSERGGQGTRGGDRDSSKNVGRGSFGDSARGRETASYGGSRNYGGGSANPDRGGGAAASGMSTAAADREIIDRYMSKPEERITDDRSYWDAVRNLGRAYTDYGNYNQGFTEDPLGAIGRTLGGFFGVGEINPLSQALGARTLKPEASWGVDPIGAALGLAGAAGALPMGVGTLYQGVKNVSGYQGPMVSFDEYDPISQEESASNWDWSDAGGLSNITGSLGLNLGNGTPGQPPPGGGTGQGNFGQGPKGLPSPAAAAPSQTPAPGQDDGEPIVDPATGRVYVPLGDPYSYGQFGPEHSFFSGQLQELNMAGGGTVPGGARGGGQDDIIPAALAPNEHVIDADVVAAIGDGNSDAGHARIEQFKQNIRKHKRGAKPGSIPPMAKSITEYMRSAA